jgi:hypothetical protein
MPVYTEYLASASVRVAHLVRCASCECEFVYRQDLTGYGRDQHLQGADSAIARRSRAEARKKAFENLNSSVRDSRLCAAVPCPECACYQRYMFRLAGEIRYGGMGCLGGTLMMAGLLVLVVGMVGYRSAKGAATPWIVAALLGLLVLAVGVVLRVSAAMLIANYNPNRQEPKHERKKHSRGAVSPEEFDKEQLQQARTAYVAYAKQAAELGGWPTHPEDQLVLEWWVRPEMLLDGGSFFIHLADGYRLVVDVPEDTESGAVLTPRRAEKPTGPVHVRVQGLRIHADERRRGGGTGQEAEEEGEP